MGEGVKSGIAIQLGIRIRYDARIDSTNQRDKHMLEQTLNGRTVAVPEARQLDVFCGLLERRGAQVLRCPLVSIKDAPDPKPVLVWIKHFIDGSCDDLILLTGEGLRRLLSCIERHQPEWRQPFVDRLSQVRVLTRGPKPARVLRELGLQPQLSAAEPTTAGVITTLKEHDLHGRRVGVQLYGEVPNELLVDFLRDADAEPIVVAPYIYANALEDAQVRELIERMTRGEVDIIAFTSMAQVKRLFEVGKDMDMHAAFAKVQVAAVGPVVRDALQSYGVTVKCMPEDSFFMKPLTSAMADSIGPAA